MERQGNRPGIIKPKALRLAPGKYNSRLNHTKGPSIFAVTERNRSLTFDNQSALASREGKDAGFPPSVELDSLISCEHDEDSELQLQAMCEAEMRMRSCSFSPIQFSVVDPMSEDDSKKYRNSYALMNNSLIAPERPTNPMTRDSAFVFAAAVSCMSKARIPEITSLETNGLYEAFIAPPCVSN